MKYFVAHLLTGDAYQYHVWLTRELSHRYHIVPLHERVDPHITIKNFEADETKIREVEMRLAAFAARRTPLPLSLDSFGRFGHKTVYLNVSKAEAAVQLARECIAELNMLPWMQPLRHEGEKLHASVARFMNYRQFQRVWRRLKHEAPRFEDTLDTLAILKKEPGARWETHALFPLGRGPGALPLFVSEFKKEHVPQFA